MLRKTLTGYELVKNSQIVYIFGGDGRLTSIKDLRGNAVTLLYDSANRLREVRDVMCRTVLTFVSNAEGRIASVIDLAGRSVSYEYDARGNMTTATLLVPGKASARSEQIRVRCDRLSGAARAMPIRHGLGPHLREQPVLPGHQIGRAHV